jgi:hypothetical protein
MRFIFVSLTACAVALSVAGCGSTTTGAQQEANRIKSVAADYKAAGMDCQQKIAANPDYAPLKAKTSIDAPPQFALQMLNDKTLPTKKEIALLYRVYSDGQECRKIYLDGASNMSPLVHSVLVENYAAAEKLWAQATAGRLTWGQFNEGRKDLAAQYQAQLDQAFAQINSQLRQENQAEIAQQQQARAAAIANMQAGLKRAGDAYANMPVQHQQTWQCNTTATSPDTSYSTCQ